MSHLRELTKQGCLRITSISTFIPSCYKNFKKKFKKIHKKNLTKKESQQKVKDNGCGNLVPGYVC